MDNEVLDIHVPGRHRVSRFTGIADGRADTIAIHGGHFSVRLDSGNLVARRARWGGHMDGWRTDFSVQELFWREGIKATKVSNTWDPPGGSPGIFLRQDW